MTDKDESGLRSAIRESEREKEALEDMFKEDTGASTVEVDHTRWGTEVTLVFPKNTGEGDDE